MRTAKRLPWATRAASIQNKRMLFSRQVEARWSVMIVGLTRMALDWSLYSTCVEWWCWVKAMVSLLWVSAGPVYKEPKGSRKRLKLSNSFTLQQTSDNENLDRTFNISHEGSESEGWSPFNLCQRTSQLWVAMNFSRYPITKQIDLQPSSWTISEVEVL